MAYGTIPSEPHDHSYFRRSAREKLTPIADTIEYSYEIVVSDQPPKLGYRRVVRLLWRQVGHPALLDSAAEQQNAVRPELASFAQWRKEAWETYADRVYLQFPCGDRRCGALTSNRNYEGVWSESHRMPGSTRGLKRCAPLMVGIISG